jgi:hypothetical protein
VTHRAATPRALLALLALLAVLAAPPAIRAAERVGPETCKACHPAAYDAWRFSPHARARDVLPERSRNDRRCLGCHAPDQDDGIAAGVTCEACHGPGRVYSAPYVMRDPELARLVGLTDPGERTCAGCHTESTPSLVRFEYARKLPLIRHWEEPAPSGPAPARK